MDMSGRVADTHGFGLPSISPAIRLPESDYLTDADVVSASSRAILNADGCFSSKKRSRVADIPDRRVMSFQSCLKGFSGLYLGLKKLWLWEMNTRNTCKGINESLLGQN